MTKCNLKIKYRSIYKSDKDINMSKKVATTMKFDVFLVIVSSED